MECIQFKENLLFCQQAVLLEQLKLLFFFNLLNGSNVLLVVRVEQYITT